MSVMFPTLRRKRTVYNLEAKTRDRRPRRSLPNLVPRPYDECVPADCFRHEALGVVLQVRDKRLAVLLWRRAEPPFEDTWALPGGLVEAGGRGWGGGRRRTAPHGAR